MATVLEQIISASLPSLIETVEIRSAFSPPVTIKIRDAIKDAGKGPPNPVVGYVKPTIILKGQGIGSQVIAPGGVASPDEWKTNVMLLVAGVAAVSIAGTMFLFSVGVFAGKRKERKQVARRSASSRGGASGGDEGDEWRGSVLKKSGLMGLATNELLLSNAKRGDIVKIGSTKWIIYRPTGTFTAAAYKHPSARRKGYDISAHSHGSDLYEVWETGGSGQKLKDKPEVTGRAEIIGNDAAILG